MLSFKTSLYYRLKPFLPWRLRMAARRWHARRILKRCGDVWPIDPAAGRKPDGWPGWPDGKQFALVLTHDVEGPQGLANVKHLAELEMSLGFRSSFNFIPEGSYRVPSELREWLVDHGFEVGVHDLYHDGMLYRNREHFRHCAEKINRYLDEWSAVGFRAGFMHSNLEWLHELDILYDSSTFDTDPFEPQPDGVGTIFPFWVGAGGLKDPRPKTKDHRPETRDHGPETGDHRPKTKDQRPGREGCGGEFRRFGGVEEGGAERGEEKTASRGYVELPYTLPQDSTLFLVLGENAPTVWKRKLEWIATCGGMALVNVHPDYVDFHTGNGGSETYPAEHYRSFLEYVRSFSGHGYWNALARQIADYAWQTVVPNMAQGMGKTGHTVRSGKRVKKIWIDLDNTPHVPFFLPIIRELEARGYSVVVTARDAFQVCELAREKGLEFTKIGRHYGKNKLAKAFGLLYRALQLAPVAIREKPALAVSHGSRSQIILCNLLGIPTILMEDYEHARFPWPIHPTCIMVPEVIPTDALGLPPERVRTYPGIKEDVYVWSLRPDPSILSELGVKNGELLVVVRPPATEAHYHNPESERLFEAAMELFCRRTDVRVVLLPRNKKQAQQLVSEWPEWFSAGRVTIPGKAIDGLNLLWHADLVVSGGGTMNREAAALGVPVYSIFKGKIGAVDRYLEREGRLAFIKERKEVFDRIRLARRENVASCRTAQLTTLQCVLEHIETALRSCQ